MMKYVILCDIRSRYNVGAIFRSAEGAGVAKIFLCGYTPAPIDRFGRVVTEITKTSLGASTMVPWEAAADTIDVIRRLKQESVLVIAVEQTSLATSLFDFVAPQAVAYIFGNEISGIPDPVLAAVDVVIEIPMSGQKESLNVSVTAGIVLFQKPV